MSATSIKSRITTDTKTAMKSGDKSRLGVIRLISAAIKQREVDERVALDDEQVITVLDKMCKQRRESIEQYEKANRDDLAQQEAFELEIIKSYLPAELTAEELTKLITEAISVNNASSIRDMGTVMAYLKPEIQGRADLAKVSQQIKALLNTP
ncbi:MAG: GatB/YqeY domain-containing protein [Gammaproteobacteria bacterium]|nr:GatB/YqeY domain-containing protein [Gammaproteobacteria bacterium]